MDYAIKAETYPSGMFMYHVVDDKFRIVSTHTSAEAARREIWDMPDGYLTGYYDSHNQLLKNQYGDII